MNLSRLVLLSILGLSSLTSRSGAQSIELPAHLQRQGALESRPLDSRQPVEDLQAASYYWYESRNPANLPAMERALAITMTEAKKQALLIHDYQTWEEAQKHRAYHDAGATLLAKCYTLLYYGEVEKARPAVKQLADEFPFAMMLRPDRSVIWARHNLRYHEHVCMMYAAIVTLKMDTLYFPAERDEFDGPAQRMAVRDMARLRLMEGNVEAVERLATMASTQSLRTTDSTWVIEEVYDAMRPLANTPGAWMELGQAVQRWRLKKPDSLQAKIAEARYLMNHALQSMKDEDYPAFREQTDRAKALLAKLPHDCPGWYSSMIFAHGYAGSQAEEVVPVFKEGFERYPDYSPLHMFISRSLTRSGAEGSGACARFVKHLVDEDEIDHAALVLRQVYQHGQLDELMPRLDMNLVRTCLASAIGRWYSSLELRSDLAMVALTLGQRDIAQLGMEGMAGRWNRGTWKGREDLARELSTPVQAPKAMKHLVQ